MAGLGYCFRNIKKITGFSLANSNQAGFESWTSIAAFKEGITPEDCRIFWPRIEFYGWQNYKEDGIYSHERSPVQMSKEKDFEIYPGDI